MGVLTFQRDLKTILSKFGLELKMWSSNFLAILYTVSASARITGTSPFDAYNGNGIKVLSMQWKPANDVPGCALHLDTSPVFTKRDVFSFIASIFDLLDLFSPATFYAKHIMQRTWLSKLRWDD